MFLKLPRGLSVVNLPRMTNAKENKPEWVKQREMREKIGEFVLWLFTDISGILLLLLTLWIFRIEGKNVDLFFTAVVIYAGIGIYKAVRFVYGLLKPRSQ